VTALVTEHGQLYKVTTEDGCANVAPVSFQWPVPNGTPGAWVKATGKLVPCENGLHLCRRQDLVKWLGPAIFEAEARGSVVVAEDKLVVREARLIRRLDTWNERTARLFACDCAEHILDALEDRYPSDPRSRNAIAVARRFANGQATQDELYAAGAAAGTAARAAARAAAWDAAWAAARDAARDAAWAAAWAAARAAERQWQTSRLFQYLDGEAA
jgi:hypothetical protein